MNATLLVPETVWCVHPISGMYTQFQRILFWVIIIQVLFFQFHQWLVVGSIALAATYSFTASIHAVALGTHGNSSSDGDLMALQVILQSSIFASLLCLLFCPRLFKRNIEQFWIYWCLLIFLARLIQQVKASEIIWGLEDDTIPVSCSPQGLCPNPCQDIKKATLFRKAGDPLQAVIWSTQSIYADRGDLDNWIQDSPRVSDAEYRWLGQIWAFYYLLGPVLQFVIVNAYLAPREGRNFIFHRLRMGYVPRDRSQPRARLLYIEALIYLRYFWIFLVACSVEIRIIGYLVKLLARVTRKYLPASVWASFDELAVLEVRESKFRYWLAKLTALFWYLWAEVSYPAFIGGTAYLTYKAERSVHWIPESESKRSVGQWSTWAGFGMAVFAASISRLCSESHRDQERRKLVLTGESWPDSPAGKSARMSRALKEHEWNIHKLFAAQLVFRWMDFKYWWLHTIEASTKTWQELHSKDDRKKAQDKELRDEFDVWATLTQDRGTILNVEAESRSIHPIPPSSKAMDEFNFIEDEETEIFLQRRADEKAQAKRTSWWDRSKTFISSDRPVAAD